MRRSPRITLTVLAAMGLAGAQAPAPATKVDPKNCDEARKAAKQNGTSVPQNCLEHLHGVSHGGFGAIAARFHGGG
jgi:hypothetical protein